MTFSLQVKYRENSFKKGDVVAVREDGFNYTQGDCLKEWLKSGRNKADWKNNFVVMYITDTLMTGDEPEVAQLLEPYDSNTIDPIYDRKNYLTTPLDYNDPHRIELRETGETTIDWATVESLIVERA